MQPVISKYQMQILLLGPSGVGKTQLHVTERFPKNKSAVRPSIVFQTSGPLPNRILSARTAAQELYEVQVTDVMGWTEGLEHLSQSLLTGYEVIVYVCNVTDRVSLQELRPYIDQTKGQLGKAWDNHCHLLLATHADCPASEWQLGARSLDTFALDHRLTVIHNLTIISAKDPVQVKAVFDAAFLTVYSMDKDGVVRKPAFNSFPADRMPANAITTTLSIRTPTRTPSFQEPQARAAPTRPSAAGVLTCKSDAVADEACEGQSNGSPTEIGVNAASNPSDAPPASLNQAHTRPRHLD